MYSVSNKYKQDMKEPVARLSVRGTIGNVSFTEDNIAGGSFSIANACVDNDEILLGSAYIGELQATFQDININRYEWEGKVITPIHRRTFSDGTFEEIPLGIYTIKEATWSMDGVSVIAYDNMSKLDQLAQFDSTSGSAYSILTNICESCGLTFGMTRAQVEALPNGTEIFGLWTENDIETYRDMISTLAQALCSIVLVDRQGAIYLKTYGMTAVDTVPNENRYIDASFSDYESRYSGISIVDVQTQQTRYYGTSEDIYLTYNLGANPWLQFGTSQTKERMARAILNSLAATAYIPYSATMLGDPAYDLGDVLTLSGGLGDSNKHYVIQRYSYVLHTGYTAEGVGKNPNLANAKSKAEKNLAGLANTVRNDQIQYYTFRNMERIQIINNDTRHLFTIYFTAVKSTIVVLHAEILVDVITETTAEAIVTYYINNTQMRVYKPTETWIDGKHILHLLYHLSIQEADLYSFEARLTMSGGSLVIEPEGVQASIHGQGLAATDEWDGNIYFEENLEEITMLGMSVENITVEAETETDAPHARTTEVSVGEFDFIGMELEQVEDILLIDKYTMSTYTYGELAGYTHSQINNLFIYG